MNKKRLNRHISNSCLYIVRHGQTELNFASVLQGRSDYPLDPTGVAQAAACADRLAQRKIAFDHVFCSPLSRARQTACILAPNTAPIVDERLIEMDYGPYEGASLTSPPPQIIEFFSDFKHCPAPEGMEQLDEVVKRVGPFIDETLGLRGNILVSTHAIAMKAMLEYLTPTSEGSYWSKNISNCAIYVAEQHESRYATPRPWP